MKQIKAVALCRVSTREQLDSNSLNRQDQSVNKVAESLNVPIVRTWSGDVSSKVGKNVKRKDLLDILDYCMKDRQIGYLIVDEVDRFMRSIKEMFYWEVVFEQIGVKVWYTNPELNGGDSRSTLLRSLDGFRAEGSNEERIHKSINGHNQGIREGRYTFPPKPGYQKGSKPGVHEPHPAHFEPFKRALKEVSTRLYTPSEALKRLNQSEFTAQRSALKIDKFLKFLIDPYYYGVVEVNRQVQARNEFGLHLPMITQEEHAKIVEVVTGRSVRQLNRKQYNPDFPLSNLVLHDCAEAAKFTGFDKNNGHGKKYAKYRCRVCKKEFDREKLHMALDNMLANFDYEGAQRKEFMEAMEAVWRQKQQDNISKVKALQTRLEQLESEKSGLVRELASADSSIKPDIQEEIRKIKARIIDTEAEINKSSNLQQDLIEFVKFGLEYTNELKEDWWSLDKDSRLQCEQLLFPDRIIFDSAQKVRTTQISPLYRLAANKKDLSFDEKSLLVELRGFAPRSAKLLTTHLQV